MLVFTSLTVKISVDYAIIFEDVCFITIVVKLSFRRKKKINLENKNQNIKLFLFAISFLRAFTGLI